jgi:hypothetical protein
MKAVELLNETKDFYAEDTSQRATIRVHGAQTCLYTTPDGRHCAIGRKLPQEILEALGSDILPVCALLKRQPKVDSLFDLPEVFLSKLQDFHDDEENWNCQGLSQIGNYTYQKLLNLATEIDRLGRVEWERLNEQEPELEAR